MGDLRRKPYNPPARRLNRQPPLLQTKDRATLTGITYPLPATHICMKAAHRHELETNVLAQRLEAVIDRLRPYAATIAGIILALVVVMFIWSYVSGSSSARQGAAWDAYNQAVLGRVPNLDQLRRTAEEFPGTTMQHLADITWADGQVFMAAEQFLYNRSAVMAALDRAASAYQSVLQTSNDERLHNRAHLGLARIYEMRNELDRARAEYLKVTGGYQEYARLQAERLAKPETKEDYAWLAKAEATRPRPPAGPGVPGQRPDFSDGDIPLPDDGSPAQSPEDTMPNDDSFDALLRGLQLNFPDSDGPDRYDTNRQPSTTDPDAAPPAAADTPTTNPPATETK